MPNKRYISVLIAVSILAMLLFALRFLKPLKTSPEKFNNNLTAEVSSSEIEEAKAVLIRYLVALGENDTETILEVVPDYCKSTYEGLTWSKEAKNFAGLKVVRVNNPGRWLSEKLSVNSYTQTFGHPPFRIVIFNVILDFPAMPDGEREMYEKMYDSDYELTKDTQDSPWLVSNFGR